MIPPLPQVRQRSIRRWLTDYSGTGKTLRPEEIEQRVADLDEQMVEAFDAEADAALQKAASSSSWGTPEATAQQRQRELEIWQSIVEDFLPTTAPQPAG